MIKVQDHLDRFQQFVTSGFYYVMRATLSIGAGFLTAKCALFDNFSPFAMILLSVSPNIGLFPTFCYLGSAFGFLTGAFNLSVFKYITALTMIYVVYMVFRKSMHIVKNDTGVLSAACCFTSGFLFLLVGQLSLFNVLILIGESVLVCCCIYFISYAVKAFRQCCYLSSREMIAAAITMILILVALHNVYFFQMSIARIVAMILLLLAVNCLKTSHTAVLGSCLGIILAAVANGGEAVFTGMIVGTLVACVFSAFSDRFAMTAFVIVYYAVLFFFGKFPWNYWYFSEPLVAYAFVFILPKAKLRGFLSSYIAVKDPKGKKSDAPKSKELIEACRKECQAICPKATICYEKNAPELSEALEALTTQFCQTEELGNIESAIPFCIKPRAMAEIIERRLVYSHSEAFEDMIEQLDHLSRKIERKMDSSIRSVRFLTDDEETIKKALEKRRITVKDINFILDEHGCRKCDIQFTVHGDLLYEKIIKETVAAHFPDGFTVKINEAEGDYAAHIKESCRFTISCAALCKTKNGEQISGDTALGFSADKNLYYLLLADGMGSGKEAGVQSEMLIDTLRRLITGGLSVPNALNIYRSASRFRQDHTFATIDSCAIDLNKGTASFYKAGAYDSFHIHDDQLTVVRGGGMPLGLSENDRLRHAGVKVADGDFLILASDGLSALNEQLGPVLLESRSPDVRTFAQKILYRLAESVDGANDDVTVMVCKFHKVTE